MSEQRRGLLAGALAYTIWGLFPLYWPLLRPASAVEVLGHRVVWTAALMVGLVGVHRSRALLELRTQPRVLARLAIAAVLIAVNWGLYIWAVNSDHVIETSLGYFITPLLSVVLGVTVLHERLRPLQWAAVGVGVVAVLVLTAAYGRLPWIALVLAASFGTYGLLKKTTPLGPRESLAVESWVLLLPAVVLLGWMQYDGSATFLHHARSTDVLLVLAGAMTAVPLMLFGFAAQRVALSTVGFLQYLAPVLQFGCGVLAFHESMPASRWMGFGLVWAALVLLSLETLRHRMAGRLTVNEPAL